MTTMRYRYNLYLARAHGCNTMLSRSYVSHEALEQPVGIASDVMENSHE